MIAIARAEEIGPFLAARARGAPPLAVRGLGTRAGPPPAGAEILSLAALAGIEELDAEEQVLTALAGTPVDAAARVAVDAGCVLCPLIVPGLRGTLGGLHGSGDESPAAPAEGRVRDAVLGLEGATGDGAPLRSGGRVVKNVTGYDLSRFLAGAHGTLGVVARFHWRLRRRSEAFVEAVAEADARETAEVLAAARRAPDATALRVELAGGRIRVRALVEGSAAVARGRAGEIARALGGDVVEVPFAELAAWLEAGPGPVRRGGARALAAEIARLGASASARATAFPFAGELRIAAGGTEREEGAVEDPMTTAVRGAWDPQGRLWAGTGTR